MQCSLLVRRTVCGRGRSGLAGLHLSFHQRKRRLTDRFGKLQHDVSRETVADNHVGITGDDIISLGIADKVDFSVFSRSLQKSVSLCVKRTSFSFLAADV